MINYLFKNQGILLPVFIYWAVLVLFMNLFQIPADSIIMVGIKIVLLIYLIISFLNKTRTVKINYKNLYLFLLFLFFIIAKIFFEHSFDFRSIVNYSFTTILVFFLFVLCSDLTVSLKELYDFYKLIIYFVLFSCIYAIIFQSVNFISSSSLTNAYSNQLKSFYINSHEYGLYLCIGIIGILFFFDKDEKNKFKNIIILSVFLINLILTFSRNSIAGLLVFVLIYIIYTKNVKLKYFSVLIITSLLMFYLLQPTLQDWVFRILLKSNNDSGRFDVWYYFFGLFKSLSFESKIMGLGFNSLMTLIENNFSLHNIHNGFLQILLLYGIIGFVFFVGIIISQLINNLKIKNINKEYFGYITGMILFSIPIMLFNTPILFGSSTDSFMITVISIIIPKYLINYLSSNK